MNYYVVVYLAEDGVHQFTCGAKNAREARQKCHNATGTRFIDIVEVRKGGEN